MELYSEDILLSLLLTDDTRELGFKALVSKYSETLYWHVRRIVLVHEDANDVVQEVFIKAWQNLHSFRGDSKIITWLYRIATNESLSHLRKNKSKYTVDIDNPDLGIEQLLTSDDYFDGDEAVMKLQKAILTLPERQRLVFLMRYYDDLKYKEIAKILDLTEGSLKATYHHALQKIEEYLRDFD